MFTDKAIKAMKSKDKPYRRFECGQDKGFGIQVSIGVKAFFVQYHSPVTNKRRFMRLGTYPGTSLAEARQQCRDARGLIEKAFDPQLARDEQAAKQTSALQASKNQAEIERTTGTVADLFEAYLQHLLSAGKRSHETVRQLFNKDIGPKIGQRKARDVTTDELVGLVKAVLDRGAQVRARDVRAYLMSAYEYGIASENDPTSTTTKRFRLESNPARSIASFKTSTPGNRELKADEVRRLWAELENAAMSFPAKTVIRLLLATGGQRVEEVLGMRWDELDLDAELWILSADRTKNGRPHVVPLCSLVQELINEMKPLAGEILLFPSRQDPKRPMPFRSISQAVRRFCAATSFPKFTPRDIRRTAKSRMGEIGISKEIRDRIHNHALHDVSSKHYDRYDYLPEKRHAMEVWSAWLERTISDESPSSNVVSISRPSAF